MKRVVIVGGGFAGSYAAQHLENDFDVTLIDTKDYFEFTPGILRAIIRPLHMQSIQVCHKNYLKKTRIVRGKATDVTKTQVSVGRKSYPFDYLIVATGSSYSTPIKEENIVISTRASTLRDAHQNLERAQRILIIGGGIVGVELAGEIATMPGKTITIIHDKEMIMQRANVRTQYLAKKFMDDHGVKLILGEKVTSHVRNTYLTDKGNKITTDIVFLCTGISPNSALMRKHFSSTITKRNQVKVDPYLQIIGNKRMFALGDVNDIKEEKLAQNAKEHAKIVVKNILAHEKGHGLTAYVNKKRVMIISLGPTNGIISYDDMAIGGIIPALLKQAVERKEMMKFQF